MNSPEIVASGYSVVEGPVLDRAGRLFFTDVHEGGVFCLHPDGNVETVVPRRRGVGGLCLHQDGGLVVSGRDVTHVRGDTQRTLIERSDLPVLDGVPVGGFNDLCADQHGRVLVGPTRRYPLDINSAEAASPHMSAGKHVPSELIMLTGEQEYSVLYDDVRGVSNGVTVSMDNSLIFHSESGACSVRVSRFVSATEVVGIAHWSTSPIAGHPDGVALDVNGFLWVAMFGGGCVIRFSPAGEIVDQINVPATRVTNLSFGGDDMADMYITTMDNDYDPALRGCIFRIRSDVQGAPVPAANI
jgi:xylono-1,5-lactonase